MHRVSKYWIILMVNSCRGEARGKDKKEGKQIKDYYIVQLNSICNATILRKLMPILQNTVKLGA